MTWKHQLSNMKDKKPELYTEFSHFFDKSHKDYKDYQDRAFELWHNIGYNNAIDENWIRVSPYKKDLEAFIYRTNVEQLKPLGSDSNVNHFSKEFNNK